jgi:hypothetical protein
MQHRWTAVELNVHLEDPVSTKTDRCDLHKSNIHRRAAVAKALTTESNAQMCKRLCHDHKTWTSDNWKRTRDLVRWAVLHSVPYSRKILRLESTQGEYNMRKSVCNDEAYVTWLYLGEVQSKTDPGQGVSYSKKLWEVPLSALHAMTNIILNQIWSVM